MSNQLTEIRSVIDSCEDEFNAVLANEAMKFRAEAGFAFQILSENKYFRAVAKNNPTSVKVAIRNVAALDLTLNKDDKLAYLTPRKIDGVLGMHLSVSYMGMIQKTYASGVIDYITAQIVRLNDSFEYLGPDEKPKHSFNPFKKNDRGEVVGAYCYATTPKGLVFVEVMDIEEIHKIREASESWKNESKRHYSPWHETKYYEDMVRKTVIRKAYKFWPQSSGNNELQDAIKILNEAEGIDFSSDQKKINVIETDSKMIDLDVPEPEPQEVGPDYIIHNAMYRGKRLCEIPMIDLEDYKEKLEKRENPKTWELELINVINEYFLMGGHDETAIDASEVPFE